MPARQVKLLRAIAAAEAAFFILFDIKTVVSGPELPPFILAENLVYAVLLGLPALLYKEPYSPAVIGLTAAFAAGRVSRSVVTATGDLAPLAAAHAPLLVSLAVIAVLAIAVMSARLKAF